MVVPQLVEDNCDRTMQKSDSSFPARMSPLPPNSGARRTAPPPRGRTLVENSESLQSVPTSLEDYQEEPMMRTITIAGNDDKFRALQRNIAMLTNMRKKDAIILRQLRQKNEYLERQNTFLQRREEKDELDLFAVQSEDNMDREHKDISDNESVKTNTTRPSATCVQWGDVTISESIKRREEDLKNNNAKLKQELLRLQTENTRTQALFKQLRAKALDYDQYKGLAESKLKSMGSDLASAIKGQNRAQEDLMMLRAYLEECRTELKELKHQKIHESHKHATDLESLQGSKEELELNVEVLQQSLNSVTLELKQEKMEKVRLVDEKGSLSRELTALKQLVQSEGADSLELARRLEDFEKEREQQQLQIVEHLMAIDGLKSELDHHKVQLATTHQKLQLSEKRSGEVETSACQLAQDLKERSKVVDNLRAIIVTKDLEIGKNTGIKSHVSALQEDISRLHIEIGTREQTIGTQQADLMSLHSEYAELADEKASLEAHNKEISKSLTAAHEQITMLREALATLRSEYEIVTEKLRSKQTVDDENKVFIDQLQIIEKRLADAKAERDQCFAEKEKLMADNKALLGRLQSSNNTQGDGDDEIIQLKTRILQMESEHFKETDKLRSELASLSAQNQTAEHLNEELEKARSCLIHHEKSLEVAQHELDETKEELRREKASKATDILSEENKARNVYDIINHVTESCNGTTLLLGELNEVNDVNISSKEAQLRLEGIQENIAAVMRLLDQICFLFPRKSQENS